VASSSKTALTEALPVPDMVFGGSMLVLIIMFHAFWIRFITGAFLKRTKVIHKVARIWHADLLFALTVIGLLTLHMAGIMLWTAALGEPFALPHAWRMLAPIVAISGIFTFSWTASVLVNFVARYNDLRAALLGPHGKE
jgi:hypothetical protein